MRRSRAPSRLAALLFGLLLGLGLCEIVLAWTYSDQRLFADLVGWQGSDEQLYQVSTDPELLYELKPGAQSRDWSTTPWGAPGRQLTINALGFRDKERTLEKPPGTIRILAVGGSNTFGALVNDDQTWPAQLERVLLERGVGPVEVWNLGVSAYVHRQKRRLLERWVPLADADIVLLQLYNTGPRVHLASDEGWRALMDDPGFWPEQLMWAPSPDGLGGFVWRHWRLLRLAVVVANRRAGHGAPPVQRPDNAGYFLPRDAAELDRLMGTLDELGRPWLSVRIPASRDLTLGEGEQEALVELQPRLAEHQGMPGLEDVHPPAEVYALYAEILADELLERGMVGIRGR